MSCGKYSDTETCIVVACKSDEWSVIDQRNVKEIDLFMNIVKMTKYNKIILLNLPTAAGKAISNF